MADIAITFPDAVTAAPDRYRLLYAAMEAVRLKHNTRAGDVSPEAIGYRRECIKVQTALIGEMLKLREAVKDKGWTPKDDEQVPPTQARLKTEGYAEHRSADVKAITGVDLDRLAAKAELPPDPLENFTTYTEVDSASDITVGANTIGVDTMARGANSYVYKDFGAGHFATGLTHYFTATISAMSAAAARGGFWGITNVYGTRQDMISQQAVLAEFERNASAPNYRVLFLDASDEQTDTYDMGDADNTFYCAVNWPDATNLTLKLYSDSGRTTLLDTLAISVTSGRTYQYMNPVFSREASGTPTITYSLFDLDLNEAVASSRRRRLICGVAT